RPSHHVLNLRPPCNNPAPQGDRRHRTPAIESNRKMYEPHQPSAMFEHRSNQGRRLVLGNQRSLLGSIRRDDQLRLASNQGSTRERPRIQETLGAARTEIRRGRRGNPGRTSVEVIQANEIWARAAVGHENLKVELLVRGTSEAL